MLLGQVLVTGTQSQLEFPTDHTAPRCPGCTWANCQCCCQVQKGSQLHLDIKDLGHLMLDILFYVAVGSQDSRLQPAQEHPQVFQ